MLKRSLHGSHSLAFIAVAALAGSTVTAKPQVITKMGGRDMDPLFLGNIDLNPVSIAGVKNASSAAVQLVADVPKLPQFDLAKMTGFPIDSIASKAHGGGITNDGLTKMGNQDADNGPHRFARKVFAAGNLGALVAGTLVAQNLAETARTPAVAFA